MPVEALAGASAPIADPADRAEALAYHWTVFVFVVVLNTTLEPLLPSQIEVQLLVAASRRLYLRWRAPLHSREGLA